MNPTRSPLLTPPIFIAARAPAKTAMECKNAELIFGFTPFSSGGLANLSTVGGALELGQLDHLNPILIAISPRTSSKEVTLPQPTSKLPLGSHIPFQLTGGAVY